MTNQELKNKLHVTITSEEARGYLYARRECIKLSISCKCDKDCEYCRYNYGSGNMGEQLESLIIAIYALDRLSNELSESAVK